MFRPKIDTGQMKHRKSRFQLLILILLHAIFISCHNQSGKEEKDIVKTPVQIDNNVGADLKTMLVHAAGSADKLNDSTFLNYRKLMDSVYENNSYTPLWSNKERWLSPGDSLFSFIANSKESGLFPSDYHYPALAFIR